MMRALLTASVVALLSSVSLGSAVAETVLNRGNDTDPTTLDHQKTSTVAEGNLLRDLYEGLVTQDADAKVVPGVAESWDIAPDGLTYTFRLRADAKWSNGEPVKASDFVFAFRRLEDAKIAASYANMLYPIVNAESVNKGQMAPDTMGVRAIDDRTLEIKLSQPTPYFLELLTHQVAYPLYQANVETFGDDFAKAGTLVSNGAYALESFTPNDRIVMRKSPTFHGADAVKIDVVNWIPFEDRSACLRRFEAGEVLVCSDLPYEQLSYMKDKLGAQVHVAPYLGTYYLNFKMKNPKFQDVRVRQAISMAIDRDFLADKIWNGGMVPGYSFVPPGISNYDTPVFLPYKDTDILDREDDAKKLLADAGVQPGTMTVDLRYNTSENHKNTMTAVADMLKNIGINATLTEQEGTGYFDYLKNDGDFDIARAAWIGDYSDPQNFLFLFESQNLGFNYPRWANADYDALMKKAGETGDIHQRSTYLAQAEQIFLDQMPAIPVMYYGSGSLVSSKLTGWNDNILNVHGTRYLALNP